MTVTGFNVTAPTNREHGTCSKVHNHGNRLQCKQLVRFYYYLNILPDICFRFFLYVFFPSCKCILRVILELWRVLNSILSPETCSRRVSRFGAWAVLFIRLCTLFGTGPGFHCL